MDSKKFYQYHLFYMFILTSVAVGWMLIYTKPVLMPLVFATFYYFASLPLMNFLETKLKIPQSLSSWLTGLVIGAISTAVIFYVSLSLKDFFWELKTYRESFLNLVESVADQATKYGINLNQSSYYDFARSLPIQDFVTNLLGDTFGFLGNAFLILVLYSFLMLGRAKQDQSDENSFFGELGKNVSQYVVSKVFLSALTGFLIWVIFVGFGVKLALTFAILVFVLNFIPTLGSIIATLIPVPMLALQFGFSFKFFLILSLCTIVQGIIGNILDPKIIGKDLDLHPIAILLSLIFWSLIWGIGGAFLAIPLTASLKLLLSKMETTQKLSEMLAGRL